jgi:hypothetical protein
MSKNAQFEDRVVAFIDILGFRQIVDSMARNPARFQLIRDVLEIIQRQERKLSRARQAEAERERRRQPGTASLLPPSAIEMTAFSDCYVVSALASAGWKVMVVVQALAAFLIYRGILLRGGVAKGKAYHTKRVLFGPAVIAAYELQQHTAKYPRIVVEDHLVRSEWWLNTRGEFFRQDGDGCWFVNPFERGVSRWSELLGMLRRYQIESSFLGDVRKHIARLLSDQMRSRRRDWDRIAKLRWLAARFNDAIASQHPPGVVPIDLTRPLTGWPVVAPPNPAMEPAAP